MSLPLHHVHPHTQHPRAVVQIVQPTNRLLVNWSQIRIKDISSNMWMTGGKFSLLYKDVLPQLDWSTLGKGGGAKLVLNVCALHMLWLATKSEGVLFI